MNNNISIRGTIKHLYIIDLYYNNKWWIRASIEINSRNSYHRYSISGGVNFIIWENGHLSKGIPVAEIKKSQKGYEQYIPITNIGDEAIPKPSQEEMKEMIDFLNDEAKKIMNYGYWPTKPI